jgi:hypothetical protein
VPTISRFENICLFHILDGLRDGLSHFSRPTRVAMVYAIRPDGPLHIYDPMDLMRGHESKLKSFYLDSDAWRKNPPYAGGLELLDQQHSQNLQMAGIASHGGRADAVAYQMWFTEQHSDMCSLGPIRMWLEYAVRLFAQNYEIQSVMNIDTAGYVLQHCANHSIRDFLVEERSAMGKLDTQLRIYPLLDAVLGISKTREEGAPAWGEIAFVEPCELYQMNFLALFPDLERPLMTNHKHVRKLLQSVEKTDSCLVSDGQAVIGIATGAAPDSSVIARFHGNHGFLWLNGLRVCSFADGNYHASTRKANLVELEEKLIDSPLSRTDQHTLMRIVTRLVESAAKHRHGAAIVLDFSARTLDIPGQSLVHALDLRQERFLLLAMSLAKVDGALHIGVDLKLHAFGCLLDGLAVPGENRARGARYNSSMRFSARHDDVIVVAVSSDRPVSILQNGVELTAACQLPQLTGCPSPPPLTTWLQA